MGIQSKKYATTLSTCAWDKQINTQTEIKWKIIKYALYTNLVILTVIFVYQKSFTDKQRSQ